MQHLIQHRAQGPHVDGRAEVAVAHLRRVQLGRHVLRRAADGAQLAVAAAQRKPKVAQLHLGVRRVGEEHLRPQEGGMVTLEKKGALLRDGGVCRPRGGGDGRVSRGRGEAGEGWCAARVVRLDVSMRHAQPVHVHERGRELRGDRAGHRLGQPGADVQVGVGVRLHVSAERAAAAVL